MKYVYSRADLPSEDLASGRVLFSRPGFTAFPVRLASELFLRAISLLARWGRMPPYHLYDPTCGGGYLAITLGFLHSDLLRAISMSDISDDAVALAIKNAALLTPEGLSNRRAELCELAKLHGRESHLTACRSAARLLTHQPLSQREYFGLMRRVLKISCITLRACHQSISLLPTSRMASECIGALAQRMFPRRTFSSPLRGSTSLSSPWQRPRE